MHKRNVKNLNEEVILTKDNYSLVNPIDEKDIKRKKVNGSYIYEKFYLIDFLDIKKDSYVISSFGRLFSLITQKELKPVSNSSRNNYASVQLKLNDGKSKKFAIHRLVARAFVIKTTADKQLDRKYVHHKNWDNDYNYYWNLEWRSQIELKIMERLNSNPELQEADVVKEVCVLLERGTTINDIHNMLGKFISIDKISRVKSRQSYAFISRDYRF